MKKSISKALALLTIFTVACAENTLVENSPIITNSDTITEISITGKDFQFEGDTRSSVSVSESGVSFLWDEDDVIGIFPDEGDQVSFAMEQGAGTQTATFTGGGWALKSSATYAAYYPHVYENRDLTKIPVSYVGQTQNGNANTDHIGAYDFMAASVTTPSNGTVAFDMQHLGALVQLTITVPEPSTLTKVVLTSSTEFTETGTIDLTTETVAIMADTQSNSFEIALNNVTTTEANETVTVYFMTAPVDLTNSDLTATIHFANETIREAKITGKNLQAGKAFKLSAEIEANFYLDGVAFISDAGILSQLISTEDKETITSLKIVGNINGSDVKTLNTMPSLKSLDLFSANIVEGGEYYYVEVGERKDYYYYTENNKMTPYMFTKCNLEKIILPQNITYIGCGIIPKNQLDFIIPPSVKEIGTEAFYNHKMSSFVIPDSVEIIATEAFYWCKNLTEVTIPSSVTQISNDAFDECTNLQRFITTGEDGAYIAKDGILYYDNMTCLAIVPEGYQLAESEHLIIPETVNRITGTFYCRQNIKGKITIPGNIREIPYQAFAFIDAHEIVLSKGIQIIQSEAFHSCSNLKIIRIPSTVYNGGRLLFWGCNKLEKIYINRADARALSSDDFSKSFTSEIIKLYIPKGTKDSYANSSYWSSIDINNIFEVEF